ncbi:beta-1,3-galactosyltransferase 5-like [Mytilus edulis]|uniref:beta-1,3-galactosyltransferase 5-like n=1 Tax=Mytilus edulis TaxID=6550 RepID=UPI0039F0F78B
MFTNVNVRIYQTLQVSHVNAMRMKTKQTIILAIVCALSLLTFKLYCNTNFVFMKDTQHRYMKDLSFYNSEDKETPEPERIVHKTITKATGINNKTVFKEMNISTEFEYFYLNVSQERLNDALLHKHQYRTLLNNDLKCIGKNVFLLVFVHVASHKILRRHLIRSTYGSISEFEDHHIEYIFVLGQTSNITVQREINDESRKYKDIVQGNFVDSYRNLTYKLVFSMFWVNSYCSRAKYVIKVDDDLIINIPFVMSHLQQKAKNNVFTNVLECITQLVSEPLRKGYKTNISILEYPFQTFPPYCSGASSIMSMDVIRKMYDATKQVPFIWIEDVYGGGFLPWVSNIEMQSPRCFLEKVGDKYNDISCSLVYLTDSMRIQRIVWETISNRTKFQCKC